MDAARHWFHFQSRLDRCRRLRDRRLLGDALEQELELRRVELLALAAEEPTHQRVDLLAQERVLTFQVLVALLQLGFAGVSLKASADVRSSQHP